MPNAGADNLEKALDLLIHEVRSPVSVAQGYLRLLLDNRLTDAAGLDDSIDRDADAQPAAR